MAKDKPSLTPHRDQVERMIAANAGEPRTEWRARLAVEVGHYIQRAFADERDRGIGDKELAQFAPTLMRCVAQQTCAALGIVDYDPMSVQLLLAAASPETVVNNKASIEKRVQPAAGGQA